MVAGVVSNEILSFVSPARLTLTIGRTMLTQSTMTNRVFKYSAIEGSLIGKNLKSTSFELKFEAGTSEGRVCKLKGDYEAIEASLPTKAETKEMMGTMVAMFKAAEGYLVTNPDVYA
ncbi:major pollen allergen Aln g 1-like protein [Cinnamomum micranthum f. kanehirae]|uniref:Major pollen allergen Aln g 1-like protein n=1 Tax=Cinnamomum micranthum f. kanehirae TaxID=337451 RepID=A0A443PRR1_9MAGN|nr:major pollen allergen Aln g 1-like protein [Cinnamomum micranthum f. kanehirae]